MEHWYVCLLVEVIDSLDDVHDLVSLVGNEAVVVRCVASNVNSELSGVFAWRYSLSHANNVLELDYSLNLLLVDVVQGVVCDD